ncbi:hypothetical protein OUZ56_018315 [Daphnia magna]|uniref:Uncharacterized protein n=1 Tax=Daphnia magna TaxID=35525 RepID=A0ABQ9Z8K7_9CRUS|nr:hypothetical protein OUZ56_018315 [Daphnia magna]
MSLRRAGPGVATIEKAAPVMSDSTGGLCPTRKDTAFICFGIEQRAENKNSSQIRSVIIRF